MAPSPRLDPDHRRTGESRSSPTLDRQNPGDGARAEDAESGDGEEDDRRVEVADGDADFFESQWHMLHVTELGDSSRPWWHHPRAHRAVRTSHVCLAIVRQPSGQCFATSDVDVEVLGALVVADKRPDAGGANL